MGKLTRSSITRGLAAYRAGSSGGGGRLMAQGPINEGSAGGNGTASGTSVAATPDNYTAGSATVESHLSGIDAALGNVETSASNASAAAAAADAAADAAQADIDGNGTILTAALSQAGATWTDTPTITTASDLNGKLIHGSAATAKTATLPASIAAGVWCSFVNIGTSTWSIVGDGTSVLKDASNTTVWTGGAGNGVTVQIGGSVVIRSEGSSTWRVYQGRASVGMLGSYASPTTTNPLSLAAVNCHGLILFYGATGEIDLPAGAAGMNLIVYNTGSFTITFDPNGSEIIIRDGTAQTGGVSFTLSSGSGNFVGLVHDGARWVTLGYKGTLAQGS